MDFSALMALIPQSMTIDGSNYVGFILPIIIDILGKDIPDGSTIKVGFWRFKTEVDERLAVAITICLIVAVIKSWSHLDLNNLAVTFGMVFTESQLVYKLYFQNSWFRQKLQVGLSKIKTDYTSEEIEQAEG